MSAFNFECLCWSVLFVVENQMAAEMSAEMNSQISEIIEILALVNLKIDNLGKVTEEKVAIKEEVKMLSERLLKLEDTTETFHQHTLKETENEKGIFKVSLSHSKSIKLFSIIKLQPGLIWKYMLGYRRQSQI